MRKNYALRRWKSSEDKALLYLEGQDLIIVFRPNFENLSRSHQHRRDSCQNEQQHIY